MKEFEKQLEKYINDLYPAKLSEVHSGQVALDFWKAALEWVQSKVKTSNSDGSIVTYINQELKNE